MSTTNKLHDNIIIRANNYKSSNMKHNISFIIFSRASCCIGIVIFHYFERARGDYKLFFRTANSSLGFLLVTVFFNISGTVLYYKYNKKYSLKQFYYKRWKSILPSYYNMDE